MAETRGKEPGKAGRKKWERPRLTTEKLFERNSLACGKSSPRTPSCFRRTSIS